MNVRLDIGTPFKTLFQVNMQSVPSHSDNTYELRVSGVEMDDRRTEHGKLGVLVKRAMSIYERATRVVADPEKFDVSPLSLHLFDAYSGC